MLVSEEFSINITDVNNEHALKDIGEVKFSNLYSVQANDISRNVAGCQSLCLGEHEEHLRYEVNCKTRRMIVRYNKKHFNK